MKRCIKYFLLIGISISFPSFAELPQEEIGKEKHKINKKRIPKIKNQSYIKSRFDYVGKFSNGLAKVKLHGRWGFINKSGKLVIPIKFDSVDDFEGGVANYLLGNGFGMIHKSGIELADAKNFSEGLSAIQEALRGKYGYVNNSGDIIIPFKFDYAKPFSDGLAEVELDGRWGYINKTGNIVIQPQFDDAGSFSDGLAEVELDGKTWKINKKGKFIKEYE